ncbi:MAG: hypothetical protein JWM28_2457 [Chitinophagaceae bacterium]|nr:hypothetical protein [Chitinophagaceae bacterium]
MTEKLLQFIWQFQYFNKSGLVTATGERIQVIYQGIINHNQGPDFLNAKIKIGSTTWAGTVELHVRTSDWKKHNHEGDKNYNNVILHVVWQDDESIDPALREVQTIPVFELQNLVSKLLLQRYEELMNAPSFIPCEKSIHSIAGITWNSWKERLLAERLLRKAAAVEILFQQSNNHWTETFWWLLARNFGMNVNTAAFESIARSIPVNILAKHKNQIHQLESLLFGQAGLLKNNFEEDYPRLLQREYKFLRNKYQLKEAHIPVLFLRMRPGNFPTIRLAQLAALVNESAHLFSKIKEAESVMEIKKWFHVTANDYWHYHYKFDESTNFKMKTLGASMIANIVINTLVPVLFAYGNYQHENKYKLKALQWLEETAAEINSITSDFQQLGIENKNAYDSQALIELKNKYCNNRKCLDCSIGNAILKQIN